MNLLLIDDEAPARLELRTLLSAHDDVRVVGEAADVRTALELTASLPVDVVFLDVRLVGESGFDYAERLPKGAGAPRIIFVTAYERYAVRGFECNALHYLLKPIDPAALAEALDRIRALRTASPQTRPQAGDAIFLKTGEVARQVPWREIEQISSAGNYTRVHLADGGRLIILRPLKEWLGLAPEGMFLQVHRTTIVQMELIREIRSHGKKRLLLLHNGALQRVGREYFSTLRRKLGLVSPKGVVHRKKGTLDPNSVVENGTF